MVVRPRLSVSGDADTFRTEARNRVLSVIQDRLTSNIDLKSLNKTDLQKLMQSQDMFSRGHSGLKSNAERRVLSAEGTESNGRDSIRAEVSEIPESERIFTKNGLQSNFTDDEPEGNSSVETCDTYIYPLVQMGQLGIYFDELAFDTLLRQAPAESNIHLASGYFNLTDDYINTIIHESAANYNILTASPQVRFPVGPRASVPREFQSNLLRKMIIIIIIIVMIIIYSYIAHYIIHKISTRFTKEYIMINNHD